MGFASSIVVAAKPFFSICQHRRHRGSSRASTARPATSSAAGTAAGGKATLSLGAGEVRHVSPFGRKRSVGLKRLNEALQILRLLWDAKEPVNFEGEIWTLKDAWIGAGGQQNRPEVVAMGGGPKLINMADWAPEGIEPVMPLDWHYALHMKPNSIPYSEIQDVISRVTPEMVRKTFFHSTPAHIAAEIRPFAQAGANLNLIADLAPLLMPVDPAQTVEASAEICRLVKQA